MKIINLVFKGVSLGLGIAVTVLSILNVLEPQNGILMLGLGLACLSIVALSQDSQTE